MGKIVNSFSEVDFSGLKLPVIAIYDRPEDFPDKCVARIFDVDKPTDTCMIAECVWELKWDIEKNTNMTFIPRFAQDVRSLVGTYI